MLETLDCALIIECLEENSPDGAGFPLILAKLEDTLDRTIPFVELGEELDYLIYAGLIRGDDSEYRLSDDCLQMPDTNLAVWLAADRDTFALEAWPAQIYNNNDRNLTRDRYSWEAATQFELTKANSAPLRELRERAAAAPRYREFRFALLRHEEGVCTQTITLSGEVKAMVTVDPAELADLVKIGIKRALVDWFNTEDGMEALSETGNSFNIFDLDLLLTDEIARLLEHYNIRDLQFEPVADVISDWGCDDSLVVEGVEDVYE
jgi:hypothetical protein